MRRRIDWVKTDSATTSTSKAHATLPTRRDGASSPSGVIQSGPDRQFVLNGRKMDTRREAAANEASVHRQKKRAAIGGALNVGAVARRTSSPLGGDQPTLPAGASSVPRARPVHRRARVLRTRKLFPRPRRFSRSGACTRATAREHHVVSAFIPYATPRAQCGVATPRSSVSVVASSHCAMLLSAMKPTSRLSRLTTGRRRMPSSAMLRATSLTS